MSDKVKSALEITQEWAHPDYGWTANEHTIFHALRELVAALAKANERITLLDPYDRGVVTKSDEF